MGGGGIFAYMTMSDRKIIWWTLNAITSIIIRHSRGKIKGRMRWREI
jgi:hypothetical protein